MSALTVKPIGVIRTEMRTKFDAPHQPTDGAEQRNIIELDAGSRYEEALTDLAGFDRIWIVWWSHKNSTWRPRVLPPRGDGKRRGVFATRSPHRPNPICLTAVALLGIEGRKLIVGNTDLLDGTPVLDIKPYIPAIDSFPNADIGWLGEVERSLAEPPAYTVSCAPLAREQIDWLRENFKLSFIERATELLARDPTPHRTRRICREKNGRLRISCGPWRAYFSIAGKQVTIDKIVPGFPERSLKNPDYTDIPNKQAQIAFGKRWNDG